MARATKLKVFRTAIGFHDAYVAAPSRRAALEAWGSDKDLFARGVAELVTDPALTEAPLATPGKVLRRLRGTSDEQMAALAPDRPRSQTRRTADPSGQKSSKPSRSVEAKPTPPAPSRSALTEAEEAVSYAVRREREAIADLDRREAELARERKASLAAAKKERVRLARACDLEASRYDRAVARRRR